MMKQTLRFMTVPKSFWDNEQLSLPAKWIAITIDSYTDNPMGVAMGVRAIQTATNLSAKEVKEALTELRDKGCLQVNLDQDGQKLLKVLLYKDRYVSSGEHIVVGDKPTDAETIDYAYVQEQWNSICTMLPPIERLTPRRKTRIRSVIKQSDLSVEDFIKCFKVIACTPFLSGQSDKFKATFDWLTASSQNTTKVFEGFYSRSYQEKQDYNRIMHGGEVNQHQSTDDYYR